MTGTSRSRREALGRAAVLVAPSATARRLTPDFASATPRSAASSPSARRRRAAAEPSRPRSPRRRSSHPADPPAREWAIAVVAPHLRPPSSRDARATPARTRAIYDYVLTYDRELAIAVAAAMTARVA